MLDRSEKPYLDTWKTSGHERLGPRDIIFLKSLKFELNDSGFTPVDIDMVRASNLSEGEVKIVSYTGIIKFLPDENTKQRFPLEGEDLGKWISLLKTINFSQEEIDQILSEKTGLHDAIYLRELSYFEDRIKDNEKAEKWYEKNEQEWDWANGDYGKNSGFATRVVESEEIFLWDALRKIPENLSPSSLLGEELTTADIIQQQLDSHVGNGPLIFLDVGGLAGLSWYKLANHFKNYVKSGKAVFVVTSLGADFNQAMKLVQDGDHGDESGSYNYSLYRAGIYPDDMSLVMDNKDLVCHVSSNVPDLLCRTIRVGEEDILLRGNVALVNDNHAVAMHSLIPSVHLPMLVRLLNNDGVYKSTDTSVGFAPKKDSAQSRDAELYRVFRILQHDHRMEMVEKAEQGSTLELEGLKFNHIFFRKPGGPKIRAFLLPEQLIADQE